MDIPIEVKRKAVQLMAEGVSAAKIAKRLTEKKMPITRWAVSDWKRQIAKIEAEHEKIKKLDELEAAPQEKTFTDVIRQHLPASHAPKEKQLRGLLFDIETLPNQGYFFDTYSDRAIPLPFVRKPKSICTVAYKWLGEETVNVVVAESPYDDRLPCKVITEQFEQADYVIGHHIKGFDIPFIEGRLWHNKMPPLPAKKALDTYKIAKSKFGKTLNSNRLDHLGELLQLGNKIKTDAMLWVKCAEGDKEAIEEMARYNIQDVNLLERVYNALKPQFTKQINAAMAIDDAVNRCKACASENLTFIGYELTAATMRPQHRCNDCGAVSSFKAVKHEPKA